MREIHSPVIAVGDDADLVRRSLGGGREAFAKIVARYQSLICALTYSATGSFSRSEDLAQETFITAWKRLAELREPAHLRAWLCGIARNLARNAQRSVARDPVHLAEPLDPHEAEAPAPPSPAQQAISQEEEAILWRVIEQIAETYRVPLILFYREHRSIAEVAAALGLSEDAVKQRLARGRALVHAQVLALVATTLERSKPGPAFTLGVTAALPLLPASAFVAGAAATKTGVTAKTATWLGPIGAIVTAQVLWFVSSLGFVAFLGGWVGWQMSDFGGQSRVERALVVRFWRSLTLGLGVFVFPAPLLLRWLDGHPWRTEVLAVWQGMLGLLVCVPLAIWAWENHIRVRRQDVPVQPERQRGNQWLGWAALIVGGVGVAVLFPGKFIDDALLVMLSGLLAAWGWGRLPAPREGQRAESADPLLRRSFPRLVALTTCAMTGVLVAAFWNSQWETAITPAEARQIIAAHPEARYRVTVGETGAKTLRIVIPGKESPARYYSRLDEPTLSLLRRNDVPFETRPAGGTAERTRLFPHLFALCLAGASAGATMLARTVRARGKGSVRFGVRV